MFLFSGVILAAIATTAGLRLATGRKRGLRNSELGTEEGRNMPVRHAKEVASGGHPSPQCFAGTSRQPLPFRAKAAEPAAVLAESLVMDPKTPVILRKVADNVLAR
jgi:hypothetical protein